MSSQYREAPRHFLLCTLRLQRPVAAASEVLVQFRSLQEFLVRRFVVTVHTA